MKKWILFLGMLPLLATAKTYMAKIEPIYTYEIYAQSQGEIVQLDEQDENKLLNKVLIKIDNTIARLRLKSYEEELALYTQTASIKEALYEKSKNVRGKSQTQIDTLLLDLLDQKVKINTLALQIAELKEDLSRKEIRLNNLYLKELYVHLHDYVSVGTKVAKVFDISKGKLLLYVHKDEIDTIKKKQIYFDGKPSRATISKVDVSLDETYVSSYKVELICDLTEFGRLVSVEFK